MASPDDPDATVDAGAASGARRPLSDRHVEPPVYRPRRSAVARYFWLGFVLAVAVAALVIWLVLA